MCVRGVKSAAAAGDLRGGIPKVGGGGEREMVRARVSERERERAGRAGEVGVGGCLAAREASAAQPGTGC